MPTGERIGTGATLALGLAAMLVAGCQTGLGFGGGGDTDDATGPPGGDGPAGDGPSTPGGACESSQDCGSCEYCDDGECVEEFCCAEVGDTVFRCSPPDDCELFGDCDDDTGPGADPVDTVPACAEPMALTSSILPLESALRGLAALDVDADGGQEIVVIDAANVVHALAPDGTEVATLDLGTHVVREAVAVDGTALLVTGETSTGYAVARVEATTPGVLSATTSTEASVALEGPAAVADFDGDGQVELGLVAGARMHLWAPAAPPSLTTDAGLLDFVEPGPALQVLDVDVDGVPEIFAMAEDAYLLTIGPRGVTASFAFSPAGALEGAAIARVAGEPDRLVVASETELSGEPWTLVAGVLVVGGELALGGPFGLPHPVAWLAAVDLDADGTDELLVGHHDADHTLSVVRMLGTTPECVTEIAGVASTAPALADLEGDGRIDLLLRDGLELQIWSAAEG